MLVNHVNTLNIDERMIANLIYDIQNPINGDDARLMEHIKIKIGIMAIRSISDPFNLPEEIFPSVAKEAIKGKIDKPQIVWEHLDRQMSDGEDYSAAFIITENNISKFYFKTAVNWSNRKWAKLWPMEDGKVLERELIEF